MKKIAIITQGVSASGKSTWTKKLLKKCPRLAEINRDELRSEFLFDLGEISSKEKFTWDKWDNRYEPRINEMQQQLINFYSNWDYCSGIVISDTNLDKRVVQDLIKLLDDRFDIRYKRFNIILEEAIKRDKNRKLSVGKVVIRKQYDKFLKLV